MWLNLVLVYLEFYLKTVSNQYASLDFDRGLMLREFNFTEISFSSKFLKVFSDQTAYLLWTLKNS
jgi:hypothetical protein